MPTQTAGSSSDVLNIGRRSRAIPPAIRRALWMRDRGCRFPETSLTNLVLLCPRHHHLVHEGGFSVEIAADGAMLFRGPTGPLPFNPPRAIDEDADDIDPRITADTNYPLWDGDVPDYHRAVSSLLD